MILTIIRYNFVEGDVENGYIPLHRRLTQTEVDEFFHDASEQSMSPGIDGTKAIMLEQFIGECIWKNIRLVIVRSPVVRLFESERESFEVIRNMVKRHPIPVWDFADDTAFSGKHTLFADRIHLNHTGAELFSCMIAVRTESLFATVTQ